MADWLFGPFEMDRGEATETRSCEERPEQKRERGYLLGEVYWTCPPGRRLWVDPGHVDMFLRLPGNASVFPRMRWRKWVVVKLLL